MTTRDELLLPDHHRLIERRLAELCAESRGDDRPALRACWDRFESALADHLRAEEQFILPEFGRTNPDEARALLAEHTRIRALVAELGVGVDLHQLSAPIAEQLTAALTAHARREDAVLYPWAARHLLPWPESVLSLISRKEEPMETRPSARAELKALLDEVRVKLHLAGMDAKDAFQDISREAEKIGRRAGREAEHTAKDLLRQLRSVAESIAGGGD